MAQTKYRILENEHFQGKDRTLYRIQAVRSFKGVREGDMGGFLESERNLSHDGNAWVGGNAKAYGETCVFENGRLLDTAHAINAWIEGNSVVFQNARLKGTRVEGSAKVGGEALVDGWAWIKDNARVLGNTEVRYGWVGGNALLFGGIIDGGVFVEGNVKIFGGYISTHTKLGGVIDSGVLRGEENPFKALIRTGAEIIRVPARTFIPA